VFLNCFKKPGFLTGLILFFASTHFSVAAPKTEAVVTETKLVSVTPQKNTAKKIVEDFQFELLEIMKQGHALGFQGRYSQLEQAILKSHDLKKIVRIVVGKEWKKLSDQQKITLNDVFSRLSISAYAFNFKEFSGESFQYQSEDETARGGIIVHTLLKLPKDKDVKFDYMLKKKGDSWRIINIIANGVSDLALKRSEYTSILKRKGFEALIAKINEKIDNYAKQ
jgi:phospholipid transport system substrate-binding protein